MNPQTSELQFVEMLLDAYDSSRSEIRQRLHDTVAQRLAAAGFAAECLARNLERAGGVSNELCASAVDVVSMIHSCSLDLQAIMSSVGSAKLLDMGLMDALCVQFEQFDKRHGIRCHFEPDSTLQVGPKVAVHVFRAIEEILDCAAKQPGVSGIRIVSDTSHGTLMFSIDVTGDEGATERAIGNQDHFLPSMRAALFDGFVRTSRTESGSNVTILFARKKHQWVAPGHPPPQ